MCKKFKKALALVLSLTLVVGAFCMVPTANAKEELGWSKPNWTENWMASLDDNIPLYQLSIPGTHDAGTYNIKFNGNSDAVQKALKKAGAGWLSSLVKGPIMQSVITTLQRAGGKCQDLSITKQLEAGVRYFDLRFKNLDGKCFVYHGASENLQGVFANCACYNSCDDENADGGDPRLSVADVFATMQKYLSTHSKEAIFVTLKQESGTYDENVLLKTEQMVGCTFNELDSSNINTATLVNCRNKINFLESGSTQSVDNDTFLGYNTLVENWDKEANKKGMKLINSGSFIPGYEWPAKFKKYDVLTSLYSIEAGNLVDGKTVKVANLISKPEPNPEPKRGAIYKTSLNLGLKLYGLSNKCGECSLLNLIETPRAQANEMNKIIEKVVPTLKAPQGGMGYGIIQIDFATKSLCEKIIALNNYISMGR